jgi:hypothetical protein
MKPKDGVRRTTIACPFSLVEPSYPQKVKGTEEENYEGFFLQLSYPE